MVWQFTWVTGNWDCFARGGGNTQEFLYAMKRSRALPKSNNPWIISHQVIQISKVLFRTCKVYIAQRFWNFWLLASFSNTNWSPVAGSALQCSAVWSRFQFEKEGRSGNGSGWRKQAFPVQLKVINQAEYKMVHFNPHFNKRNGILTFYALDSLEGYA